MGFGPLKAFEWKLRCLARKFEKPFSQSQHFQSSLVQCKSHLALTLIISRMLTDFFLLTLSSLQFQFYPHSCPIAVGSDLIADEPVPYGHA